MRCIISINGVTMKRILFITLFVTIASLQAIDLRTDKVYQPLKVVLEQAQSVENVQNVWNKLAKNLSAADKKELAAQAVAYAQEHKAALEKLLTTLGNKTYDVSKLKWAAAQFMGALYSAGSIPLLYLLKAKNIQFPPILQTIVGLALVPLIGSTFLVFGNASKLGPVAGLIEFCLRAGFTIYFAH